MTQSSQTTSARPAGALALGALLAGLAVSGTLSSCRHGEAPLPPLDDLYAYALAVAERARERVGEIARARALYHVGRVHERFGREDRALEVYAAAVEEDPRLADAHRQIGFLLSQRRNRMLEAAAAYARVLEIEPTAAGTHTRIGLIYTHLGRFDDAVAAFEKETERNPVDAATYYMLGKARALAGEHEAAIKAYEKALALDPSTREAHYNLAMSRRALGDQAGAAQAEASFRRLQAEQRAADAAKPPELENRSEQLRFASASWLDASRLFLEQARRAQDPAERGLWQGHVTEALRRAVAVDRRNYEAHEALSEFLESTGRIDAVLQAVEAMATAFADDPAAQCEAARITLRVADPASKRATVERAVAYLERALASNPEHSAAAYQWAYLVLAFLPERNDLLPRVVTRAEVAARADGSPRTLDVLAWAYHRAGRPRDARATLEHAVKKHPQDDQLRKRLRSFQGSAR